MTQKAPPQEQPLLGGLLRIPIVARASLAGGRGSAAPLPCAYKARHLPTMKKIGNMPQWHIVDNKIDDMAEGS